MTGLEEKRNRHGKVCEGYSRAKAAQTPMDLTFYNFPK